MTTTDQEWYAALPADVEFLTATGMRCRPNEPEEGDEPAPGPDFVFIEFWAAGAEWVAISEVRTWKIRKP